LETGIFLCNLDLASEAAPSLPPFHKNHLGRNTKFMVGGGHPVFHHDARLIVHPSGVGLDGRRVFRVTPRFDANGDAPGI
jgi:hypothetical protein